MKYCSNCGSKIEDGAKFCEECGSPVIENLSESSQSEIIKNVPKQENTQHINQTNDTARQASDIAKQAASATAEAAKTAYINYNNAIDNNSKCFVKLTEDETIIKSYKLTKNYIPRMDGVLEVTNKRLIFHSSSLLSKLNMEVPIDSVGALQFVKGLYFNWYLTIAGIVSLIVAFDIKSENAATNNYYEYGLSLSDFVDTAKLKGFFFVLALILLFFGIQKSMNVNIKSSKALGDGIVTGKSIMTTALSRLSLIGREGKDADRCMSEIGSLIMDIQQKGDLAIEKWKNK